MKRKGEESVNILFPQNIDPYDSYGLLGTNLARYLNRSGTYVNLFALGEEQLPSQDAELRKLVMQPVRPALGGIFLGYPTGFDLHSNPLVHMGPRVGLTMFESSKIPLGWSDAMNEMNSIVTPTCWGKRLFEDEGVTVPISVAAPGCGKEFSYVERNRLGRPLTFLTFLDRGKRKGGIAGTNAFINAFGDSSDVKLIIKSRRAKIKLGFINSNIEVIQEDLSAQELAELYASADVLINPNMGEGFGLIPREFAATGGISLATNWAGTGEDIEEWGWPLPYSLQKADWRGARSLEGKDLGVWAVPNLLGIAEVLKKVVENFDWYARQAKVKAKNIPRLYNWQNFANIIMQEWRDGDSNGKK